MSLTNHIQQAYKSFKGNDDGIDNDDDDGDADNDVVGGDVDHLPTASMLENQNNMAVGAPLGAAKNDGNLGGGNSWKLDKNRGFLEM